MSVDTAIWAVVLLVILWRVERLVLTTKTLTVAPPPAAPLASGAVPTEAPPAIPQDLVQVALQESEPWAVEETIRYLQEQYELTRDWGRVRNITLDKMQSPRPKE